MSLINRLFSRNKTSQAAGTVPFGGYTVNDRIADTQHEALIHCLVKGAIIFATAFGCISGILSQFDISYNVMVVFLSVFISSMVLSLIHMNRILFNIGYPLIFITFTSMLIRCRVFANSGFQALINIINEEYSAHFLLLFTRESTETITNRYLTITATAVFIGVFLAILVNVGIFNDMYFLTVYNLTFWPLQIGMYIGKYPSFLSFLCIFFAYFATYFLKHSEHYHFIQSGKRSTAYKVSDYKGLSHKLVKSKAKSMSHFCALSLVLALFVSACSTAITGYTGKSPSPLKAYTDPYVKIFVQNGVSGLFNRYDATGGMSNGRLGGISSVRPDYQTDLTITFAPYAYETTYLKAYVGAEYTGSRWNAPGHGETQKYIYPIAADSDGYHDHCTYTEGAMLAALMDAGETPSMHGVMIIENQDAKPNHAYVPYFATSENKQITATKENTFLGTTPIAGEPLTIDYVPYSASQANLLKRNQSDYDSLRTSTHRDTFAQYQDQCYENYLQIPPEISDALTEYHDLIGTSDNPEKQIQLVRQFLTANYTYDMAPGATPHREDFVLYFLDEQKRGYCVHFASAATLLLRSYGIPARYVEGYVASSLDISERAQGTDYLYEDFFEGENILGTENVVSVELNDGDAHAWVEVFVDGFGWVPIEATPPSDEDEESTYSEFLAALSGLLGSEPTSAATQDTPDIFNMQETFFDDLQIQASPLFHIFLWLLILVLFSPLFYKICVMTKENFGRRNDYAKGIYDTTIAYYYRRALMRLKKKYPTEPLLLPENTAALLKEKLTAYNSSEWHNLQIADLISLTEKSCFSGKQVSKETANMLIRFYKYVIKKG